MPKVILIESRPIEKKSVDYKSNQPKLNFVIWGALQPTITERKN